MSPTGKNPIRKQNGQRILAVVDSGGEPVSSESASIPQICGSIVIKIPTKTIAVQIPLTILIPEIE